MASLATCPAGMFSPESTQARSESLAGGETPVTRIVRPPRHGKNQPDVPVLKRSGKATVLQITTCDQAFCCRTGIFRHDPLVPILKYREQLGATNLAVGQ